MLSAHLLYFSIVLRMYAARLEVLERWSSSRARSIRSWLMPLAYAATQNAISAAADQAWYLIEVRKRSRDRFYNLRPLWGEKELSRRLASRSCSRASYNFVISCSKTNKVVDLRLKPFPVAVVPGLFGDVSVLHENRCRVPVLCFALQPVTALQDEDALTRWRGVAGQRASARATTDDDHIV
jgi:hypothetical protein